MSYKLLIIKQLWLITHNSSLITKISLFFQIFQMFHAINIHFIGNISLDKISKLANKMNVDGMEHLGRDIDDGEVLIIHILIEILRDGVRLSPYTEGCQCRTQQHYQHCFSYHCLFHVIN